jgi:hypothetical protein
MRAAREASPRRREKKNNFAFLLIKPSTARNGEKGKENEKRK